MFKGAFSHIFAVKENLNKILNIEAIYDNHEYITILSGIDESF